MSYTKFKDTTIVNITGWGEPSLATSQKRLVHILEQIELIEGDMISSKNGLAGEAIHDLHEELATLLSSCRNFKK